VSDTPTILVVDDEPRMIESLKCLLTNNGWEVQTAGSGKEAVEYVERRPIDCVLLDLVMPDADGLEILEKIKSRRPEIPVIIVTGYASVDSAVLCLKRGAHDYLKKPINHDELVKRIENTLALKKLKEERDIVTGKLRLSEERYQFLVQNSPDIIFTLDKDGNFSFINNSVTNVLGYRPNQLIGKPFTRLIHSDDRVKVENLLKGYRSKNRSLICTELRLKPKTKRKCELSNHHAVIVETKVRSIYDRHEQKYSGLFLGTYGVAQDITARKKAEQELMLQKAYFQQLFENSPEAIVILDYSDRIVNANRGFERLFGYTIEECKERHINDLIVPEKFVEEASRLSQTVLTKGIAQHTETVRKRKDGKEVCVAVLGYPIHFKDSQVGVYAIYSDITERKKSEKTVQDTLKKLRKAMGGIIHVMVSTVEARDPYTAGHQQRVAELARTIAQEMGMSKEVVDGIRIAGSIHDLGKIKIPAEILSNPGRITDVEFSLIKTHPEVAYGILREIEFSRPVAEIVYQHHEKIDGSGYPRGLSGNDILPEAKVLTIADVVEAIASHRPYRPALGIKAALEEINAKKRVLYDEEAVDACLRVFEEKKFQLP
jgi:PAS domain S-box-containing protein